MDVVAGQGHVHRAPDQRRPHDSAQVLSAARAVLHERGLEHATVQVENGNIYCAEDF
ncbi:hypothetical protein [Mycobacterium tilburgii]|uniref:hypothetical protein n=1 Tax=Mycobacterium tilburgii TaxID=44467 RepID=UPI00389902B5